MEAQLQYARCTKITLKIPFHRFERFQYMVLAQYLIDQSALDWRSYHYDTCRLCFSEHFPGTHFKRLSRSESQGNENNIDHIEGYSNTRQPGLQTSVLASVLSQLRSEVNKLI